MTGDGMCGVFIPDRVLAGWWRSQWKVSDRKWASRCITVCGRGQVYKCECGWDHCGVLIEGSETSAIRTQTPGNYPKENILYMEKGESLKSRITVVAEFQTKILEFPVGPGETTKRLIEECCRQFGWIN